MKKIELNLTSRIVELEMAIRQAMKDLRRTRAQSEPKLNKAIEDLMRVLDSKKEAGK